MNSYSTEFVTCVIMNLIIWLIQIHHQNIVSKNSTAEICIYIYIQCNIQIKINIGKRVFSHVHKGFQSCLKWWRGSTFVHFWGLWTPPKKNWHMLHFLSLAADAKDGCSEFSSSQLVDKLIFWYFAANYSTQLNYMQSFLRGTFFLFTIAVPTVFSFDHPTDNATIKKNKLLSQS